MIKLPELPAGWKWNEIRRVNIGPAWYRQYVISASKNLAVEIAHASATITIDLHAHTPEDVEDLFQNAFNSVVKSAAFKPEHQPVMDKIQEIGASFDAQRSK